MKPIFTVDAGEFLVGDHINRTFGRKYSVWVPTKDSGVDLLVIRNDGRGKPVKLQVKFSRSFKDENNHKEVEASEQVLATSWFPLKVKKVKHSTAHLWVFIFVTFKMEKYFVIIPTTELQKRMPRNSGPGWHLYLWACAKDKCYDVRSIKTRERLHAVTNGVTNRALDFSAYLDKWSLLDKFSR